MIGKRSRVEAIQVFHAEIQSLALYHSTVKDSNKVYTEWSFSIFLPFIGIPTFGNLKEMPYDQVQVHFQLTAKILCT